MKIALGLAAALLCAGVGWSGSAYAQGTPQGSYLRSCTNVSVGGDTLSASCRRADGREDRTALSGFRRCVGDIGNSNGALQCTAQGGAVLRGQVMNEGPRGGPGGGPGYGGPGGGPGYGGPPAYAPGYGREAAERCGHLHREAEELRGRLEREYNPYERGRIEGRLREVQHERERCR